MANIQDPFDDARCYWATQEMRWPDGVIHSRRPSASAVEGGRDDSRPDRRRQEGRGGRRRFEDLSAPTFAGRRRARVAGVYPMGPRRSGLEIGGEPEAVEKKAVFPGDDARRGERLGVLAKAKPPTLGMLQRGGEVEIRMPEDVERVTRSVRPPG